MKLGAQGAATGAQQQLWLNAVAKELEKYDPNRFLSDGVADSALLSGLTSAIGGTVAHGTRAQIGERMPLSDIEADGRTRNSYREWDENLTPSHLTKIEYASAQSVTDKLHRYLLNPKHQIGRSKAEWFKHALGYTRENAGDLTKQLVFNEGESVQTEITPYGTKFTQIINVIGANGRTLPVTTIWIRGVDGIPKLVTTFPKN